MGTPIQTSVRRNTRPAPAGIRLKSRYAVPPIPVRPFTVAEYHRMAEVGILDQEERVELLEGLIVAMPIRKPEHDGTIYVVEDEIHPLLPIGWHIRVQGSIITDDSHPQPDLAVVRDPRSQYVKRHPRPDDIAWLLEVSDATLVQDQTLKLRIYARAKIPVYWIVNLVNQRVEVYTDPSGPADKPHYRHHRKYGMKTSVPVVVAGEERGHIAVRKFFP